MGGVTLSMALVGTQLAVPILLLPLVKVMVPVGPAPLLLVMTKAVSVTLVPAVMEDALVKTSTTVEAWLMVTLRVLLLLGR